jgi:hypothetical protein
MIWKVAIGIVLAWFLVVAVIPNVLSAALVLFLKIFDHPKKDLVP